MSMDRPKGLEYHYIGDDEQWHIRDDAPEWAKKEFEEIHKMLAAMPDEKGIVTQY